MAEKLVLTIDLSPEKRQRIEELAHERGYNDLSAYVLALIDLDAHSKEEEDLPDEDLNETILEDFRQGWHEAMTGQTRPVSELWDALHDDD